MSLPTSDFGKKKKYNDGRTKQQFKDSADVNQILKKAQKAGTLSHLEKHGAYYGDFADFDFDAAQFALAKASSVFEELPSEIRKEFDHSPAKFFEFVNDPANAGDLAQALPELAEPGRQMPNVIRSGPSVAAEEANQAPEAPTEPAPDAAPASSDGG